MNAFLATHRTEFKAFIDTTCDISTDRATSAIPPSYATPITILGRLPATSREGFPSLPYLIDQARECAALVGLWLDGKQEPPNNQNTGGARQSGMSEEVMRFDQLCAALMQRTRDCLSQAEQAERPSGVLEVKWEELVQQMDKKARLRADNEGTSTKPPPSPASTGSAQADRQTSLRDSHFNRQAAARRPSTLTSRPPGPVDDNVDDNDDDNNDDDDDIQSASSQVVITPPDSASSTWDPTVSKLRYASASDNDGEGEGSGGVGTGGNHSLGSSLYSLETSHDRAHHAGGAPSHSPISRDGLAAAGKARFTDFVGGFRRKARERERERGGD